MIKLPLNKPGITLLAILLPLLLTFGYVVARSGPLAPVPVTVIQAEKQAISPALFGLGIVEAQYRYRIGPTMTGHVLHLDSHVGDMVTAGQVLGSIDPVDLNNKIASSKAAIKRTKASVMAAEAQVNDAVARERYAQSQSLRYQQLVKTGTVSNEANDIKIQEYQVAKASLAAARANLNAAREELEIQHATYAGLVQQLDNLRLLSPVDGLVVGRYVEPGSTVVAGQAVLEVIDPASIWINVRFDQLRSRGLASGLTASIELRSIAEPLTGRVARVEPLADAVTEEILAKIVFDQLPESLPPIGELAEVTVNLPQLAAMPVVPNASIKRINGQTGVWVLEDASLRYAPVEIGIANLDGQVQVLSGLNHNDQVVVYSKQALSSDSRVSVVDQLLDDAQ
ncbi:MAG: efflux RND transporter periplasmic adaptor subunit [Gammaproteobacteria bacterium]|nr:efflux RND transporter periplasmic adaptor subunit [Gammaproteobacteria bacterium]